jgi:hypothetical protein
MVNWEISRKTDLVGAGGWSAPPHDTTNIELAI